MCFFLCFSGQRGTIIIALQLDLRIMYEEHLLRIVALTGSERGAQIHPLASYFRVSSSICSSTFRRIPVSRTFGIIMFKISRMGSSLSLFIFNPHPMYLPLPLTVL